MNATTYNGQYGAASAGVTAATMPPMSKEAPPRLKVRRAMIPLRSRAFQALKSSDRDVYAALECEARDKADGYIRVARYTSQQYLSETYHIHVDTIRRALRRLEAAEWIAVTKDGGKVGRACSVYLLKHAEYVVGIERVQRIEPVWTTEEREAHRAACVRNDAKRRRKRRLDALVPKALASGRIGLARRLLDESEGIAREFEAAAKRRRAYERKSRTLEVIDPAGDLFFTPEVAGVSPEIHGGDTGRSAGVTPAENRGSPPSIAGGNPRETSHPSPLPIPPKTPSPPLPEEAPESPTNPVGASTAESAPEAASPIRPPRGGGAMSQGREEKAGTGTEEEAQTAKADTLDARSPEKKEKEAGEEREAREEKREAGEEEDEGRNAHGMGDCSDCGGSGWLADQSPCACLTRRAIAQREGLDTEQPLVESGLSSLGVPVHRPDDLPEEVGEEAKKAAMLVDYEMPQGGGLVVFAGRGSDAAAVSVAEARRRQKERVWARRESQAQRQMFAAFDKKADHPDIEALADDIGVVLLADLGAAKAKSVWPDKLGEIIQDGKAAGKLILISTHLSAERLRHAYGDLLRDARIHDTNGGQAR